MMRLLLAVLAVAAGAAEPAVMPAARIPAALRQLAQADDPALRLAVARALVERDRWPEALAILPGPRPDDELRWFEAGCALRLGAATRAVAALGAISGPRRDEAGRIAAALADPAPAAAWDAAVAALGAVNGDPRRAVRVRALYAGLYAVATVIGDGRGWELSATAGARSVRIAVRDGIAHGSGTGMLPWSASAPALALQGRMALRPDGIIDGGFQVGPVDRPMPPLRDLVQAATAAQAAGRAMVWQREDGSWRGQAMTLIRPLPTFRIVDGGALGLEPLAAGMPAFLVEPCPPPAAVAPAGDAVPFPDGVMRAVRCLQAGGDGAASVLAGWYGLALAWQLQQDLPAIPGGGSARVLDLSRAAGGELLRWGCFDDEAAVRAGMALATALPGALAGGRQVTGLPELLDGVTAAAATAAAWVGPDAEERAVAARLARLARLVERIPAIRFDLTHPWVIPGP
ncbi:MAG: hypothetical protein RLZZ127_802 [Planctomycetota bacterium]|jgi:hypothetical protein